MRIGLDIGSTTIKITVIDGNRSVLFSDYQRHYSQVIPKVKELLSEVKTRFPNEQYMCLAISGSAGMGLAENCNIPFVQEVHATRLCAEQLEPDTNVIIELGGEDAKIIFLQGVPDARMNGTCAGGTGAFIDQMASLLNVAPDALNELAKDHEKIYAIASRCGVFAKSDIQPLINQGAREADIAASILSAVVNQTIAGLAQGRSIEGKVLYLGGPLSFFSQLREQFDNTLHLQGICPENSLYYVALGAAFSAKEPIDLDALFQKLETYQNTYQFAHIEALFSSPEEYQSFIDRHSKAKVKRGSLKTDTDGVFLGIDAGSTTIKFAVIGKEGQLLDSRYQSNSGNPVPLVKGFLEEFLQQYPHIPILGTTVTGYGEDLIRNAFCLDHGIVETVAHFTAAKEMEPEVDFILDIGGQDIKCMKVHNNCIDNIYLNEACSSGCGSFLQTFASALGYDIAEFSQLGLQADMPVDLGSRCTVFMNSSVKQAQKDGASTSNISAGLSISVVKNALYKVIRPASVKDLGQHIVVQGGTFYNDAVLRAFEKELDLCVIRPDISGLMGAYGAALYARDHGQGHSALLPLNRLQNFSHTVTTARCGKCANNCRLTINTFNDGRKFISGNRCELPVTKVETGDTYNLYSQKLTMLQQYMQPKGNRRQIGIPMGLNMYELLPFWHTFFDRLEIDVVTSPLSDHDLYLYGQSTIPSDTVCYPAKLMHGHIQNLIDQGISTIFYPCMSYNMDQGHSDNCYNCPVVAYYPEVIRANMPDIQNVTFIYDYIGLHRKQEAPRKLYHILKKHYPDISLPQVKKAIKAAYVAYAEYMDKICKAGASIVEQARKEGKTIVVLAGRPYHADPEINHGIGKLVVSLGAAVISEDAVELTHYDDLELNILNQWTYHNRLYAASKYVSTQPDMQLIQLVSFGCGCDAVTTDECRRILEDAGKIYTQIKIDEIENLGAAKIRVRSLFAATE